MSTKPISSVDVWELVYPGGNSSPGDLQSIDALVGSALEAKANGMTPDEIHRTVLEAYRSAPQLYGMDEQSMEYESHMARGARAADAIARLVSDDE
jgi:hypothetical protein